MVLGSIIQVLILKMVLTRVTICLFVLPQVIPVLKKIIALRSELF